MNGSMSKKTIMHLPLTKKFELLSIAEHGLLFGICIETRLLTAI